MHPDTDDGTDRARVGAAVRALLRERTAAQDAGAAGEQIALGRGGLGLDSIALVEVLLDCEKRFGAPFDAALLASGPLTLVRLIDYVVGATRRPVP